MSSQQITKKEMLDRFGYGEDYTIEENIREFKLDDAFEIGGKLSTSRAIAALTGDIENLYDGGIEKYQSVTISKILKAFYRTEEILKETGFGENIAQTIKQRRESLMEKHGSLDENLNPDYARSVFDSIGDWQETLRNLLAEELRISPSDKGMIEVRKLIDAPEDLIEEDAWTWLDERPKEDIVHACRTLAFDSPTASVMLSLRAVEYCLRIWYEDKKDEEIEVKTWGQLLDELENEYGQGTRRPPVLSNLDYLREKRNEVSHPDESPDWREAEGTLYHVRKTIAEIHEACT